MKRAVMYLRVSTVDQTTANQERELHQVAERAGWQIVKVYKDHGISGSKGRNKRPAFDALHKAAARREFDIVMAWSVDRLGRSLQDLVGFLSELHALGVDLFLYQQGLDTTTPAGKAMFQMMGVFAEFERAMIQERVSWWHHRRQADSSFTRCDGAPTMHAISDNAVSQQSLAAPSIATYRAGETDGLLITRKTTDKIEELLGASGGNLAYAGYPYDPFVLDT